MIINEKLADEVYNELLKAKSDFKTYYKLFIFRELLTFRWSYWPTEKWQMIY